MPVLQIELFKMISKLILHLLLDHLPYYPCIHVEREGVYGENPSLIN